MSTTEELSQTTVFREEYNMKRPLIAVREVKNSNGETGSVTLKMFRIISTQYADVTSSGILNEKQYEDELVRHSIEMCKFALKSNAASHEEISSLMNNLQWMKDRRLGH